jgi:uncharacterized protein (TIGR01777 family)
MKVVIAGGSGLLGRAVGPALVADGWSVVILSRHPERVTGLASGMRVVRWDGRTTDGAWTTELLGADAVIDLCGRSVGSWPWTPGTRRALRTSRLEPRRALVDAMAALPLGSRPQILLAVSGTDAYVGADTTAATEDTPPADTFLGRLCADWETEARRASELGVRVVMPRLALVVAPGAPALARLTLPVRLFVGGRIGSGRQWMSWVHIGDVVGAFRLLLRDASISGPMNVASPGALQQVEVARALGRILHRPSRVWTPALAVRLALGGQSDLVLGSRRVSPARLEAAGFTFRWSDFESAVGDVL